MTETKSKPRKTGKQSASVARETRRRILKAALNCFANKGFKSTTLRDVADEAGTTHGLVRHYFGSKDLLWKECVTDTLEEVQRLQRPILAAATDENALESFKTVVRALIRHSAQNPELWKLLIFEALKDSERLDHVVEIILPLHRRIDPLFQKVQDQGYLNHYTSDDLFLLLISLGAFPFAAAPISAKLFGKNLLSRANRKKYEDTVIDLLFDTEG